MNNGKEELNISSVGKLIHAIVYLIMSAGYAFFCVAESAAVDVAIMRSVLLSCVVYGVYNGTNAVVFPAWMEPPRSTSCGGCEQDAR